MTALEEARAILTGTTAMQATNEHLRAVDDHYKVRLAAIRKALDSLTLAILFEADH